MTKSTQQMCIEASQLLQDAIELNDNLHNVYITYLPPLPCYTNNPTERGGDKVLLYYKVTTPDGYTLEESSTHTTKDIEVSVDSHLTSTKIARFAIDFIRHTESMSNSIKYPESIPSPYTTTYSNSKPTADGSGDDVISHSVNGKSISYTVTKSKFKPKFKDEDDDDA